MKVRLRPHHVLCSVGFEGEGYNDAFLANMALIVNGQMRQPDGPQMRVIITGVADSICAPCPRRVGLGCEAQSVIDDLDRRHAAALDIAPGQILTWGECMTRVRTRVEPDDLDTLCEGCKWLPKGMCKRALKELKAQ